MTTKTFNSKQAFRSEIKDILDGDMDEELPLTLIYKEDTCYSQYNFLVTQSDPEFFIDPKGRKWIKAEGNEDI